MRSAATRTRRPIPASTWAGLRERTRTIVTYPQYWGFRLTGVAATDVTSLGCHTDLWNPHADTFSSLVERLGLSEKIAPPRRSGEVLGQVLPDIARRTGLRTGTPVLCGIHDSNASLLPHILNNTPPFSVISTGTWVIAMSIGGKDVKLAPEKDVLINVSAMGQAVPSARFMGGREHDLAMGGACPDPDDSDLHRVLDDGLMLLPSLAPETGPFRGEKAEWLGPEPQTGSAPRGAAMAIYLAMVTAECLENIGHDGPIIVEGPFAGNRIYLRMLAAATGSRVTPSKGVTGTSQGAAMLVGGSTPAPMPAGGQDDPHDPAAKRMRDYASEWRQRMATRHRR